MWQVCGLKWAPDDRQLASGGNDNKLYCWSAAASQPVLCFDDHQVPWQATVLDRRASPAAVPGGMHAAGWEGAASVLLNAEASPQGLPCCYWTWRPPVRAS